MRETDCVLSETAVPAPIRKQEGRQSEQTEVRQARLDRGRVRGEESVAFSGSISVELHSEGSFVSTCTEH